LNDDLYKSNELFLSPVTIKPRVLCSILRISPIFNACVVNLLHWPHVRKWLYPMLA